MQNYQQRNNNFIEDKNGISSEFNFLKNYKNEFDVAQEACPESLNYSKHIHISLNCR